MKTERLNAGNKGRMTGGEALVRSVLAHGVNTVFGLPGGQTYGLFDALAQHEQPPEVINSRHEQGAAYMALGYAASTGRPGVFSVVPGPGVLNSGSALCTAYATNSRVLCLAGQVPSMHINAGWGMLHEIHDQLGILKRLTKMGRADTRRGRRTQVRSRRVSATPYRGGLTGGAGNGAGHHGRRKRGDLA